jgi:hypothetical protein
MNNLNSIAMFLILTPMVVSVGMGFFLMIDDCCARFKWYGKIMYGNAERDQDLADEFFGKMFIGLGLADLFVPCIVIYGYLYITDKTLLDLWQMSMR